MIKDAGKSHKAKDAEKNRKPNGKLKGRKPARGYSGLPKKGGHGGKFTWIGDQGYSDADVDPEVLDAKDPNFDDEDVAAE